MGDPVELSYGDTIIRQSDVNILNSNSWLNDNIIGFYFEYCQLDLFSDSSELCFVGPEVTQCIKLMPVEELSIVLDPLNISDKKAMMFALNNNQEASMAGGSHWSLLVFNLHEKQFYHLDSSSGFNSSEAKMFSKKLSQYFKCPNSIQEVAVSQQINGYDCGLHCIANVAKVAHLFQFNSSQPFSDKTRSLLLPVANSERLNLVKLITQLKDSK